MAPKAAANKAGSAKKLKCDVCGFSTPFSHTFQLHKKNAHSTGEAIPESEKVFFCELCNVQAAHKATWEQHMQGFRHRTAVLQKRNNEILILKEDRKLPKKSEVEKPKAEKEEVKEDVRLVEEAAARRRRARVPTDLDFSFLNMNLTENQPASIGGLCNGLHSGSSHQGSDAKSVPEANPPQAKGKVKPGKSQPTTANAWFPGQVAPQHTKKAGTVEPQTPRPAALSRPRPRPKAKPSEAPPPPPSAAPVPAPAEGNERRICVDQILQCPITLEIMEDPVFLADGHTYERSAIEDWFRRGNKTSPMTGEELKHTQLIPNHIIRGMLDQLK